MATTAPAKGKPASTRKASASRKASADDKGRPLLFRYHTIMKPQRVGTLVVEVPRSKHDSAGPGGVVVVRPVIAGAQVVPPEQRFDTSEPGNQVTFHVTPLARGKLPRARVEVYSAGRAPQSVPVPMKAKTQRLAWLLLALALLLPWGVWQLTRDDWNSYADRQAAEQSQPGGEKASAKDDEHFFSVRGQEFATRATITMKRDWPQITLFNAPYEPEGPEGWQKFTLVDKLEAPLAGVYAGLLEGVAKNRWLAVVFLVLLLGSFLAWSSHRPRQVKVRRPVQLAPAEEAAATEPATLRPMESA